MEIERRQRLDPSVILQTRIMRMQKGSSSQGRMTALTNFRIGAEETLASYICRIERNDYRK